MYCDICKKKIEESKKKVTEEEVFFKNYSDEKYCLEAVKKNGDALKYVKEQKTFKKIMEERHSSQE